MSTIQSIQSKAVISPFYKDVSQGSISPKIPSIDPISWKDRVIKQINAFDLEVEKALPNLAIQNQIDLFALQIQDLFAPFKEFNEWLDEKEEGSWTIQLATFLTKLPLRSARNILRLFYVLIQKIFYTMVHPIKSMSDLVKALICFIYELGKPEVWSQIGAGILGTSLGQSFIGGHPISLFGVAIASALIISGLSFKALFSNIENKEVFETLKKQCKNLPESFLTGALMGMLMTSIQKALYKNSPISKKSKPETARELTTSTSSKKAVEEVLQKYNLPDCSKIEILPSGSIRLLWNRYNLNQNIDFFKETYPDLFSFPNTEYPLIDVELFILNHKIILKTNCWILDTRLDADGFYTGNEIYVGSQQITLESF